CNTVWGWMNSTNPATQSGNQENMDWVQFKTVCGDSFKPYSANTINNNILIPGVIIVILIAFLVFSVCKHRNYTSTKTGIIIAVASVILLVIVGFLSRDLAGVAMCNGKSF